MSKCQLDMQLVNFYINGLFSVTLIPCILDMARSGRRALRVRIVLNACTPPAPAKPATKLIRDTYNTSSKNIIYEIQRLSDTHFCLKCCGCGYTITIVKSNQHHAFVKYVRKPSASHFTNISSRKIMVKILSM